MADISDHYNRNIVVGCVGFLVLGGALLVVGLILATNQARRDVHYPGATQITSHNNYSGLPYDFRWDDSFRTTDSFPDVYSWYSIGFDLGAEARALGGCILLEGSRQVMLTRRQMSVLLCDTPTERLIYVTRSTSLR